MATTTTTLVKDMSTYEMMGLLDSDAKFAFVSDNGEGYKLIYEVFMYSDERDIALSVSDDTCIFYEQVYPDLATLIEHEPFVNLSKFRVEAA